MSSHFMFALCLPIGFAIVYAKLSQENKKNAQDIELGFSLEQLMQVLNILSLYLLTYTIVSILYWSVMSSVYSFLMPFMGTFSKNIFWLHSLMYINVCTMYLVKVLTRFSLFQKTLETNRLVLVHKCGEMCALQVDVDGAYRLYKNLWYLSKSFIKLVFAINLLVLSMLLPVLGPFILQMAAGQKSANAIVHTLQNSNCAATFKLRYKKTKITKLLHNLGYLFPYIALYLYFKDIQDLFHWTRSNGYLTKLKKQLKRKKSSSNNKTSNFSFTNPFQHLYNDIYRHDLYKKL
ncbi:hypothetical protein TPHA_0L00490 [Tetrapisispora phaffii CBS 4417]|uniref:Uncharacterized protein n=1 Tax=Tetrapisispora phaffii (strain ATCC 24235 / CBS 4417 / NBRC 1672 / NRRL Y-8282 / UCD 70-5) TaxID=1071381 RepID=G8BZS7_TETPH|nr:hypothetical protein TPHA_0L00490 [Tetrapisispora phaffii CBS 4417]CCE65405.1 hypothetical protein TPHA_0L00490 [Tetrapisispora phaffii CBS 4417]